MMNNLFIRIAVFSFSVIGVYKVFPQVSKPVDYYIQNPSFQKNVVIPSVQGVNNLLPSKLQLPVPEIKGVSADYPGDSPFKIMTDEIGKQAASVAATQVDQIKKNTSSYVCQALLERIKSECGQ